MAFIIYFKYTNKPDWKVTTQANCLDEAIDIAREYMEFADAYFIDSPIGFKVYQFIYSQ